MSPARPARIQWARSTPAAGIAIERAARGFTLLELLVVVTLLAILATLLLPALARGRSAALATECRGNLHHMGLALQLYVDDWQHYPLATGRGFIGYSDANNLIVLDDWKETLIPYIDRNPDKSVVSAVGDTHVASLFLGRNTTLRKLRCPQDIRKADGARGNGQYAYNAAGTARFESTTNLGLGGHWQGRYRATAESRIVAPAAMVAMGDIAPGASRELISFSTQPEQAGAPALRLTFDASGYFDVCSTNHSLWPGTSHHGRATLLCCDGHVESRRQISWVAHAARPRWNVDHEPHPETWTRE